MSGPQEEALIGAQAQTIDRKDVAKGAGLAAVARLGALIEVIAQPAYTWMFGLAGYGVYVVLWAAINILTDLFDLGLAKALQRIVPATGDRERQHAAVRFALLAGTGAGLVVAVIVALAAPWIAESISAPESVRPILPRAIAIFAFSLPLWIFIEIATGAARAMRAFGPEIRLRIFWEQVARLVFAALFYFAGFGVEGLLLGHLASLVLTSILSWQLLGRFFDLHLLLHVPVPMALRREAIKAGIALQPPWLARRVYSDLPPILLNLMLPGVSGATAAGLFGIARKIASIPLIVRLSFLYVLAPLSSAQAATKRREIGPLFSFSTHISVLFALPIAGFMMLVAADVLTAFAPGAEAALPVVLILLLGRSVEAALGPATPIVEMTGHRALPLINSILGLALWLGLAAWLVPLAQAVGMAVSVTAAIIITALLAIFELWWSDRLSPFGFGFWRALLASLAGIALLWVAGEVVAGFGQRIRALTLLALFFPTLWLILKLGLVREDKAGLGKLAARLRL